MFQFFELPASFFVTQHLTSPFPRKKPEVARTLPCFASFGVARDSFILKTPIIYMFYLEPDNIREMNSILIEFTGGALGAVNEANLFHVCFSARKVSGGIVKVAAFYFYNLAYTARQG